MKKVAVFFFAVMSFVATSAYAENYVKPDTFKQWLESGKKIIIVDIQPADDFAEQHFKGAIETNAFPAKSPEEKARLDKALPVIQSSKDPIIIACPRGKSGARNTYAYFISKGIPEDRLLILEGGIEGWPYPEFFVKGK
jgi:rhodanese-related sulfurtransferase